MKRTNMDRVNALCALGETVLEAVVASGLLRRKPGRKRGRGRSGRIEQRRAARAARKSVAPKAATPEGARTRRAPKVSIGEMGEIRNAG